MAANDTQSQSYTIDNPHAGQPMLAGARTAEQQAAIDAAAAAALGALTPGDAADRTLALQNAKNAMNALAAAFLGPDVDPADPAHLALAKINAALGTLSDQTPAAPIAAAGAPAAAAAAADGPAAAAAADGPAAAAAADGPASAKPAVEGPYGATAAADEVEVELGDIGDEIAEASRKLEKLRQRAKTKS